MNRKRLVSVRRIRLRMFVVLGCLAAAAIGCFSAIAWMVAYGKEYVGQEAEFKIRLVTGISQKLLKDSDARFYESGGIGFPIRGNPIYMRFQDRPDAVEDLLKRPILKMVGKERLPLRRGCPEWWRTVADSGTIFEHYDQGGLEAWVSSDRQTCFLVLSSS